MSHHVSDEAPNEDAFEAQEMKRAALGYLTEAFAEARLDGLDSDYVAHAALFAAFKELVDRYGEGPVARFAQSLPDKIERGDFSCASRH